jgi:phytoene dehydrogenase-like protein
MREAPVSELEIESGRAVRAVLGSGTQVEFDECLWAAGAKSLMESLRGDQVPEMGPARVAWMRNFVLHGATPGVVLEFAHSSSLSEFTETLLLPLPQAEGEEDRRYLVGAFLSNRDKELAPEGKQLSSWIFEVAEEIAEDNHEMMKRIRAARRAIEKCFPGFEKSVLFDRVQVLPHTVTPVKKAKKKLEPIFSNLLPVADWTAPAGAHFEGLSENILGLLK